jgi:glycyl-tRNA synthetase (class II)
MNLDILLIVHTFKITKKNMRSSSIHIFYKNQYGHAYAVSQAYVRCEQGDAIFTEYFTKFKKLFDEMRDLFPFGADSTTV